MPPPRRQVVTGDRAKLQALVDLKAGGSVYGVAKAAGVTPATVRRWRDQARAAGETFPPPAAPPPGDPCDPQTKHQSAAWVSPLPPGDVERHLAVYMAEALEALHVQIALFADREWLQEQSAHDVAVAHGVIFDKLSRLAAGATGAGAATSVTPRVAPAPAPAPAPVPLTAPPRAAAPQPGRGLPAPGPGGVVAERQPGGDGGRSA
jgi:transposase-like protein